jgi:outer membrane lipoprotein-sorting protein
MKYLTTIILFTFITKVSFAQDAKAKVILDELSQKTKSYSSMSADFEYKMINKTENIDESQRGSLKSKGNKYHLIIAGQKVISNGKLVWTVLEDAEEIQINVVPDEDSEDFISPNKILTLWESGFKYKYDQQTTLDGKTVDIINLYPDKVDEQSFHTIKLFIDKTKKEVVKIEIKGKDGTDYTYIIKEFKTNEPLSDEMFEVKQSKYPDFDVIDLR